MEVSTLNTILAGTVGFITGAIGSLIAPWIHWGIEKRRKRLERRISLIKDWRWVLNSYGFKREMLINHPSYGPLQDLLSNETRKIIERPIDQVNIVILSSLAEQVDAVDRDKEIISKEITRIEKKWGLI